MISNAPEDGRRVRRVLRCRDEEALEVGLSILSRRAEGEAAWRSAIAMGSGVLFVALGPVRDRERGRCRVPRR
jgi:hypothetical protein